MDVDVKTQVREFYNQVGWQEVGEGLYQNARYEDLRPVAREYIHRCHMRVLRHINSAGRFMLDAGCGPIQYPEYLEYSKGYQARVCVDISIVALQEARKRIGDCRSGGHGLFVVADIANLPFQPGAFDSAVSLHTIHHLPRAEHVSAYRELYRVLREGAAGVIVNGWDSPPLTRLSEALVRLVERVFALKRRSTKEQPQGRSQEKPIAKDQPGLETGPQGTFVRKSSAASLKQEIGGQMPVEILVWRSVNVRTLRTFVHERWAGRSLLRLLYWLEEKLPHFFGKNGQYPLVVIRK
jgi:SAM-dependent methyltransferase